MTKKKVREILIDELILRYSGFYSSISSNRLLRVLEEGKKYHSINFVLIEKRRAAGKGGGYHYDLWHVKSFSGVDAAGVKKIYNRHNHNRVMEVIVVKIPRWVPLRWHSKNVIKRNSAFFATFS